MEELTDWVDQGRCNQGTIAPLTDDRMVKMAVKLHPLLLQLWGRQHTTVEREIMFLESIRQNDIHAVKHIASMGVDLDTRDILKPIKKNQRGMRLHPVHEATRNDNRDILETLFQHGAHYNPTIENGRWFMDGYDDLLNHVPQKLTNPTTPQIIIRNHIKNQDFAPFFQWNWRSNQRTYEWFCQALKEVEGQIIDTKYGADCSEEECGKWCKSIKMKNGRMLCGECAVKVDVAPITAGKLWVEPDDDDDETVFYGTGLNDEDMLDDTSSIGTWEPTSISFYGDEDAESESESEIDDLDYFPDDPAYEQWVLN